MSAYRIPVAGLALFMLVGCASTGDNPCGPVGAYMAAEARSPLTVPEGLDAPPATRRVSIPEGADVVHPELRGRMIEGEGGQFHCIDRPPPRRGLDSRF